MDSNKQGFSPVPQASTTTYSFPEAMEEVLKGRRITRLEWGTNDEYGLLKDGWLMIFLKGELHKWIVNDGDMLAHDWVLLPEQSHE